MKYEIYGKNDCPACTKAKALMDIADQQYEHYNVDEISDVEKAHLITEIAPDATTVPIVLVNDYWIGGCDDLEEYLNTAQALRTKLLEDVDGVMINFTKKNGEEAEMLVSLHPSHLPPPKEVNESEKKAPAKPRKLSKPSLFTVYKVDSGWRSFHYDQITAIDGVPV